MIGSRRRAAPCAPRRLCRRGSSGNSGDALDRSGPRMRATGAAFTRIGSRALVCAAHLAGRDRRCMRQRGRPKARGHLRPPARRPRRLGPRPPQGIPVTSLARTYIDLATVSGRARSYAIHRGELRGLVMPEQIRRALACHRVKPGTAAVAAIVGAPDHDRAARTRGPEERRLLAICRGAGLPRPLVNQWIALPIASGGLEVDFCLPAARLIVEVHERSSHRTSRAFRNDRARDRALLAAGWRVLRFRGRAPRRRGGRSRPARRARPLSAAV